VCVRVCITTRFYIFCVRARVICTRTTRAPPPPRTYLIRLTVVIARLYMLYGRTFDDRRRSHSYTRPRLYVIFRVWYYSVRSPYTYVRNICACVTNRRRPTVRGGRAADTDARLGTENKTTKKPPPMYIYIYIYENYRRPFSKRYHHVL